MEVMASGREQPGEQSEPGTGKTLSESAIQHEAAGLADVMLGTCMRVEVFKISTFWGSPGDPGKRKSCL